MALGVAVGMPLAEAVALRGKGRGVRGEGGLADDKELQIDNCKLTIANSTHPSPPHPVTLSAFPYDPLADQEALEALAEWSARFSPIVGLEHSTAAESLLLDVTGLAHLFGGEASLAERIVDDFTRRGLAARVAVADTLGAAKATAYFHSSIINHQSSIVLLPPGETLAALRPLPVAALRIPEETVGLLRQLGIDRIGQLEALPRGELSSRFGPQLLLRWDQAIGRLDEPIPARSRPPKLEAQWSPEHPLTRREGVEAALEQLIAQVAGMLARLGHGAVRLECRLDCSSGASRPAEPVQVSVGLFRPTASAEHLFSLARMQLEQLRLPGPLSGMHVAVAATAPLLDQQQELFFSGDGLPRRHARYLAELVERLSSRLGRRSVLQVRLVSDAQPELAWRYDPLVDGSRRRGSRRQTPTELPPRPLRLLRRPVALAATSILPGGPPVRFHFGGRSHRIAQHWGPERIETGWWRNRTVGRDYYQIETTTGGRYWLFRRLRDGRWFLHGTFE
jgi:protein ImuB